MSTTKTVHEREVRRAEEALLRRGEPDRAEQAVDHAGLRLEQLEPDDARDHLGQHVGDEDDGAEQAAAADACG